MGRARAKSGKKRSEEGSSSGGSSAYPSALPFLSLSLFCVRHIVRRGIGARADRMKSAGYERRRPQVALPVDWDAKRGRLPTLALQRETFTVSQ
jgi:hypothetical protein